MTVFDIPKDPIRALRPSREEFRRLAFPGAVIPVAREVLADRLTPLSAYERLASPNGSFLLESVEGGERMARYSYVGADPECVIRTRGSIVTRIEATNVVEKRISDDRTPLDALQDQLAKYEWVDLPGLPRFAGGAVGYIAYDAVRGFERLPDTGVNDLDMDDYAFMVTRTLLAFDHVRHRLHIICTAVVADEPDRAFDEAVERIDSVVQRLNGPHIPQPCTQGLSMPHIHTNQSRAEYEEAVETCRDHIKAGDAFQIVPSVRFSADIGCTPLELYRALRSINPSPYMYYLDFGSEQVVGSSPEILATVENGTVTVRPIAGTRPRGANNNEDAELAEDLLADEKERAEHIMLVDLGRNDLGRVSAYGSVASERLMTIEKYSHVMHMVSTVTGRLAPQRTAFDAVQACFPAGTLTGAPKVRAMQIIDELEPTRRGLYGGAVGYFSFKGNADFAIAIRTMYIKNGRVYMQAGAGVVADSVPSREYDECVNKARALIHAIALAHSGLE